jgi:large subunit ribosomal protein L19
MSKAIEIINKSQKKHSVVAVRSGDTVKVHQKIKEGNKERVQVFQGLVIRTSKGNSHLSRIVVRRIASGVGVEKSFLLHSPSIVKVEITKRSRVRRNYLSYMRDLTGKAARLSGVDFDRLAVNTLQPEPEEVDTIETSETTESKAEATEVKDKK